MSKIFYKVLQHLDYSTCWPFIDTDKTDMIKKDELFNYWYPDGYTIFAEYTEEEWKRFRPYEKQEPEIIATDGNEVMSLEEFLMWELEGGKGTYESDLSADDIEWDDLPIKDKIAYMSNSIYGDMISYGYVLKIKE
jgi:hypothetical protein